MEAALAERDATIVALEDHLLVLEERLAEQQAELVIARREVARRLGTPGPSSVAWRSWQVLRAAEEDAEAVTAEAAERAHRLVADAQAKTAALIAEADEELLVLHRERDRVRADLAELRDALARFTAHARDGLGA